MDVNGVPGRQAAAAAGGDGHDLWAHVRETVVEVDASGRIRAASPSWRTYGHPPGSLVGRPLTTVIHPNDRAVLEAYLLRPELARTVPTLHAKMLCGDASWVGAVIRLRIVEDAAGTSLLVSLLPLDEVTSQTFAAERRAADELRLIDEMKHRLLESVSHELRTPLTVIRGFADTLQRDDAVLDRQLLCQIGASIQRHAMRLEAVVADLVDLDRSTRATLVHDRAPLDLAAVLAEVVDHRSVAPRRLHLDAQPVTVPVRRSKFERIIECLLDNVRRHTPPETNVWVRVGPRDGGALLEVSDDGPGLAEELRSDVFSPFAQGRLREGASPGLGLGLALVRRFAELHGGRCWHSTPEGGGARFSVFLPGSPSAHHRSDDLTVEQEVTLDEDLPLDGVLTELGLVPHAVGTLDTMLAVVRREVGMQVAYFSTFTASDQIIVATDGHGGPLGICPGVRIPLADTYCARMVRGEIPEVVADTAQHPEIASLSATAQGIGCYVGVPVHLPNGHLVGSLCCAQGDPASDPASVPLGVLRTVAALIGEELGRQQVAADELRALTQRVHDVLHRRDGLQIVYQPVIDLTTGQVTGVEALSRFPDSRIRPADLWFADAARVGLAAQLEQLAVVRALPGLAHLPHDLYLAVNLSPAAITGGALRPLLGRVPLDRIVIEITEHAAIDDYPTIGALLRPFRDGGARLAIDDVGAGFASLRHVLRLHPDIIKLDRSLVAQATSDPGQHAITVAFGQLARQLHAKLVAEGIEDAATLRTLVDAGITHGQGWLFARPGPLPLAHLAYLLPAAGRP